MHRLSDPAILYFGTPVVLVSTLNEDGSANLAPMSSAWWLGKSCMLGFGARSKTPDNLRRTGECVLNLPSVHQVGAVDRLARLTGSEPVPPHKLAMGYQHERDKFGAANASPTATAVAGRVGRSETTRSSSVSRIVQFIHFPHITVQINSSICTNCDQNV